MTATVDAAAELGVPEDAVLGWLAEVLAGVGGVVDATGPVDDGIRVDRISLLERIKGAVAAAQYAEIVRLPWPATSLRSCPRRSNCWPAVTSRSMWRNWSPPKRPTSPQSYASR